MSANSQLIENLTIHSKLDKTDELIDQIQQQLQDMYDKLLSELDLHNRSILIPNTK